MKILQIAPAWVATPPKVYGGTEWVIANLIKGLSSLGHEITLFAAGNSQVSGKTKYVFRRSFLEQGINWSAALPAFIHYHEAFRNTRKYDVVHAHLSSETDLLLLPFLSDLSEKGIPNLVTVHSRWPYDAYSNMDSMFLKLYAGKILAVNISLCMRKTLPKQFRDGGFVYNSLDISKMKFSAKGGKYLTWLGKIIPEKGLAEAIRIAKYAGEQIIFAGIIDGHKEISVRYFNDEVKPLIDGHQIQYLGPADLKLKNKLLGGAKAFLSPLDWEEPFGMVFAESMACGTPVIVYNRGAAPEVIKDQETGFLVQNQDEMIGAISKIGQIDRKICRRHVEKNFSPVSAAHKYLRLYNKEIERHLGVSRGRVRLPAIKPESIFVRDYHSPIISSVLD